MKVPSINNIDPTEIKINYKLNKINSICMHSKCMCLFMSIILYWRLDICMYVHMTICILLWPQLLTASEPNIL